MASRSDSCCLLTTCATASDGELAQGTRLCADSAWVVIKGTSLFVSSERRFLYFLKKKIILKAGQLGVVKTQRRISSVDFLSCVPGACV